MNLNNITDIFFDLDHTLWDFEKNSALALETVLAKHALKIELSEFLTTYVPINESYWDLYRENKITKEALRFKRFNDTFTKLGYPVSPEMIDLLSEDYIVHLPDANHLFPGTVEILDYLHQKYALHIITDGFREVQHLKLSNSKIDRYFTTVTTSEDVGAKKPDARIFEHALKKAGGKKETSLMIGDNLQADVLGALNFGMHAIYFSKDKNHEGTTIDDHSHLLQWL